MALSIDIETEVKDILKYLRLEYITHNVSEDGVNVTTYYKTSGGYFGVMNNHIGDLELNFLERELQNNTELDKQYAKVVEAHNRIFCIPDGPIRVIKFT